MTDAYVPALRAEARLRTSDIRYAPLPEALRAERLRDARSEAEYLERYVALARQKAHVDNQAEAPPVRPGLRNRVQAILRRFLWRLLQPHFERLIFRQNAVNTQLIALIEFQQEEVRSLRERLARLEEETQRP